MIFEILLQYFIIYKEILIDITNKFIYNENMKIKTLFLLILVKRNIQ